MQRSSTSSSVERGIVPNLYRRYSCQKLGLLFLTRDSTLSIEIAESYRSCVSLARYGSQGVFP